MSQLQPDQIQLFQLQSPSSLQIFTNDTEPLKPPSAPPSLPSQSCTSSRNKTLRTSTKSMLKRKTSSQIIKDNILKCRYNRRVGQLKELTQHNVQMFLRIKAQQSEYKFDNLHQESSYKLLPPKTSRVLSQAHSSTHTHSQTELANGQLRSRCYSLKKGFAKEFKSVCNIANGDDETPIIAKSTEISRNFRIEKKVQRLNNKQNQVQNKLGLNKNQKYFRQGQLSEVQNKLVARKLGLVIPAKDLAMLKHKNALTSRQQIQSKRSISISLATTKEDQQSKQNKRSQGLSERYIDYNR